MPELSVVVPVYHNEENLPDLVPALERATAALDVEFVFVDDGSRDGSWRWLERWTAREPRAMAIKLSRNFGSFTACTAGLAHARGAAAVIISADLQDPPELIPEMVARWREGHEVVLAVRNRRMEPWYQRALAAAYYRLMRRWALADMPAGGFDFCLVDRKVIDVVTKVQERNTSLMGLILWTGFRRAEIPYTRRAREKGRSMWTLTKKLKYFADSLVAFSYMPIRLMQVAGGLIALLGFAWAVVILLLRLRNDIPIRGWTALMVVVLVLGGLQLLTLGVIGEYVWRTLDEAKARPLYVVERVAGGVRPGPAV
jgi:glycosyltransferase involved in cell wall biosynthesis